MDKKRYEMTVGIFVLIGFIGLSMIIFFVSGVRLFKDGYTLNVLYDYVSILDRGAPVRMAGVKIGEVHRVKLSEISNENDRPVRVSVFIEEGIRIKKNYTFKIQGTHILSEPHIEISPNPESADWARDGDVLLGVNPIPIESLIERAHNISRELNGILVSLHRSLTDEESKAAVKEIVMNLAELTRSLNITMSGSEENLQNLIVHVESLTEAMDTVARKVEGGEGTLGKLLMTDELYQELREFVKEIKARPWRLMKRDDKKKRFLLF